MRIQVVSLLLSVTFSGCGSTIHGPPTRTISTKTHIELSPGTDGGPLCRKEIRESRMSDAQGRRWTQTEVVSVTPIPEWDRAEAELLEKLKDQTALARIE
jgi:hypothetical protein